MQDNIFKNLREYYQPNILFQAHVDLILEPIHELHKLYYDNVLESKQFIYQKGYELAELKVLGKIQEHVSMKSDTSPIFHPKDLSSLLEKDQLFGTSKSAAAKLEKDTFNASQKTLTRIDKDINNILVDSYREGVGYKEVGRRLTKKFNQLQTFEAERIARTETHSAHELGTMQAFEDLDVEYLQWDAHLDNRVRETHEEIDGEIIPLDGTFSNGLKYPGDKNGPIKEWINCRCHAIPYILPPGTIAPNMPQFRESDLINTKSPIFEKIEKTISEPLLTKQNFVDEAFTNRNAEWDLFRLTHVEQENYFKYKKNLGILEDALHNKNYSNLSKMEDLPNFFKYSAEDIKEFPDLVKEEIGDYKHLLQEYEKTIKNKNIEVTLNQKIDFETLKDEFKHKTENGVLEDIHEEIMAKYHFKKENLTIYEPRYVKESRVNRIKEAYDKLPTKLKQADEIVLSAQNPVKPITQGTSKGIGGFVSNEIPTKRIHIFQSPFPEETLSHESAHLLEYKKNWYLSNSYKYVKAVNKDTKYRIGIGKSGKDIDISGYAFKIRTNPEKRRELFGREYSEDFADAVKKYVKNPAKMQKEYPNRYKVIDDIVKGKFDKKPVKYTNFIEKHKGTFDLDLKEENRFSELLKKSKTKSLSKTETKELQKLQEKTQLQRLHDAYVEGKLNPGDELEYKALYKRFTGKNVAFEEQSPIWNFTLQDEKRLAKLESEKIGFTDPRKKELKYLQYKKELRELYDNGEEILPKYEKKYEKLLKDFEETKLNVSERPERIFEDNFNFTPEGRSYYLNLKLKKRSGEITPEEKRELKELMEKRNFSSTYTQYNLNDLSYEDSKRYVKIYNKYGEKWGLELDTSKLKLISPKRANKLVNESGTVDLSSKFKITGAEEKRFNDLLLKRLLNEGQLDADDAKELQFLYEKQRFNYLYSLNKQDKGLRYKDYTEYSKLFAKYKSEWKLDDDLLDIYMSDYTSKIPLDTNSSYFKTFEGTNEEGLLPDGDDLRNYFTIDARDMTIREQEVAQRWLGPDYRMFTDFDVKCNRDIEKYAKLISEAEKGYDRYNTWEKCVNLAKDIDYDTRTLDNILNNQLKQNMTLWRVQEDHFLSSTKVGDVVDFPDFRSTAISKKGAFWFSETNEKPMKYILEIEAPKGTKGTFLAPIKTGKIVNPTSVHHGEKYANEMEFLLKNSKVEIVEFNDKKMKGAFGENLKHIKLRIVESGSKKRV